MKILTTCGFQVSSCRFRPNARSEIYFGNESIYFGQISANTTLHTCASICKPVHFKTLTNQRQACMMLPSSSTVQDVCLLDSKLLRRSFMSAVVFRKHIAVEKLQTKPCHLVRFSRAKILTGLKRAQNDNRFAIESLQDFASYDKNWLCKNLRHAWKTGRKKMQDLGIITATPEEIHGSGVSLACKCMDIEKIITSAQTCKNASRKRSGPQWE